jgi:PAS domain S-box-containing protein
MGELHPQDVALSVLRALSDVSALVFDAEERVVLTTGRGFGRHSVEAWASEGQRLSETLAPELWRLLEPLVQGALNGQQTSVEFDLTRSYAVDARPLRNPAGAITGGVCFWRDITERSRLRAELEQQGRLLDLAHDAVIVREPHTSAVTFWNRAAQEIYGYSADEARGRTTHELLATEFLVSQKTVDDALTTRGRWEGDLGHTCKDGRRIVVSSRQALVRGGDGEPIAVIELNSDVTERKHAESALRAAEERFRGLVESAPDAIVIVNDEGVIEFVNAQTEQLFGYRRAELTQQPVDMLLPEALRGRHGRHRQSFIADPRTRPMGAGLDLLARRKDGSEFVAEISLSPMHTESGLLIIAAVRDISRQLLRQLEQALVPRTKISARWELAWRYRPSLNTMLLGGDFIGVCERPNGSLSMLIGDVTGRGPTAAGTGAMLRAAWHGLALADVVMDEIPELLHRLLMSQDDTGVTLATVCLAEVDRSVRELRLIRAGHDSPLLITPSAVTPLDEDHGPALGLSESGTWPLQRIRLQDDAALMFFTDGLTERRLAPRSARLGFDELLPRIDPHAMLSQAPGAAIDELLARLFPSGTDELEDDLAVMLLNLRGGAVAAAR